MINFELVFNLAKKDILKRYKQSVLGPVWFLVKPSLMILLLYIAFYKIGFVDTGQESKLLIILSGYLPWYIFTQNITNVCSALIKNKKLIENTDTSRIDILLTGLSITIFETIIVLSLIFICLIFFENIDVLNLIFFTFFSILIFLFSFSFGSIFSIVNIWYRDVVHVLQYFISFLSFILPVGFTLKIVELDNFFYSDFNPLIFLIEFSRDLIIGTSYYNNFYILLNILVITFISFVIIFVIRMFLDRLADVI